MDQLRDTAIPVVASRLIRPTVWPLDLSRICWGLILTPLPVMGYFGRISSALESLKPWTRAAASRTLSSLGRLPGQIGTRTVLDCRLPVSIKHCLFLSVCLSLSLSLCLSLSLSLPLSLPAFCLLGLPAAGAACRHHKSLRQ